MPAQGALLRLRRAARAIADVFFPPVCVGCRGLVEDSGYRNLCSRCAGRILLLREPCCGTCGRPFHGVVAGPRRCPSCRDLRPAFRRGRAAVVCRGPALALVAELKYHGGLHVLADIGEVFRRSPLVRGHVAGAVLVPVPLHPRRRRERGFNQGELVAREVARACGGRTRVERLLRRVVDTPSQTGLGRRGRLANPKNAFALARGPVFNPRLRYILVDDVFTTGSTLNGCARALRGAGCLDVDVLTFGRG